ncbi:MAG: hypothetical protein QXU32_10550 [Nitrososphaerales archaeon]
MEVNIRTLDRVNVFGIAAVSGFVATLAVAGLIIIGETIIAFPQGFFYTVMGKALGVSGMDGMFLGFYLHLLTGTLIGVIAASPIAVMRRMYRFMGNIVKCLLYGAVMGSIVWILFYVPISYTYVVNIVEDLPGGSLNVAGKLIKSEEIMGKFSNIVLSALGFHIQYGLIYAVITGSFISRRLQLVK